jgi:hypothetical protein
MKALEKVLKALADLSATLDGIAVAGDGKAFNRPGGQPAAKPMLARGKSEPAIISISR